MSVRIVPFVTSAFLVTLPHCLPRVEHQHQQRDCPSSLPMGPQSLHLLGYCGKWDVGLERPVCDLQSPSYTVGLLFPCPAPLLLEQSKCLFLGNVCCLSATLFPHLCWLWGKYDCCRPMSDPLSCLGR